MIPLMNRKIAGTVSLAVIALSIALPSSAEASGFQVQPVFPSHASGVLTSGLPDITLSVGFIGNKNWVNGGVVVLDDMGPVIATQVGPQKDMCRFVQMDYQPGNQGTADAGVSEAKVYRGNTLVNADVFAAGYLAAGQWRPFETWQMDLKEGMNTVRVVMDVHKQVSESNENNTFGSRINVKLDCDGDGKINGVGGFKATPGKPGLDPVKPGSKRLRLKPRS